MRLAWARLAAVFRKQDLDEEFDEEVRSHIALATEEFVQRGVPPAEARRRALVEFGAVAASKDVHRDSRGLPWLEGLFYDVRFALRSLRRDRAFTLAAIAMLALSIGLNATVFTVMNTMLFRGFPLVNRNDRLVYMQERYPSKICCITYLDFVDWRAQAHTFEGMAFIGGRPIQFSDAEGRRLNTSTTAVSANAFGLLGVAPMLGRDFLPTDEAPGGPPVAIMSYRFWVSRFNQRPDIVGLAVHIDKAPATIIGVMPDGFNFPNEQDLWLPLAHTPQMEERRPAGYMAFGRLRDGVNIETARNELENINRRLGAEFPATNRGVVPRVDTWSQFFNGPDASMVYGTIWAAAWFVLLIACANLANLTLARTVGRWDDFSTRLALGAGPWRMMRQIVIESLLLMSVAGALGWWLTKWSVRTWAVASASQYQVLDYTVSSGALVYLVAISLAAAMLVSLPPIGRVLQVGVTNFLRSDARGVTQNLRGKHLGSVLVAGQMALAIVLLSGAGVLVRSLSNVVNSKTGVSEPDKILIGSILLPGDQYPDAAKRVGYFDRLEERLRNIPGVEKAALSNTIPVGTGIQRTFEIEGRPSSPDGADAAQFVNASPDYFNVVGASAVTGRAFKASDRATSLPVAVVNRSFAAEFWPGQQPVGKRLRALYRGKPGEWRTVVGVAPNIMEGDPLRQTFKPVIYLPMSQEAPARPFFLVRTRLHPAQVAPDVRAEVEKLDRSLSLDDFKTLKDSYAFRGDAMDLLHVEMGKHAAVAPVFAVIALLLAAIGLYAVIANSTTQRTKEIGVRMAIGARAVDIRGMVVRDGMLPVGVGVVCGLGASLAVNRVLQSQLVGVSPYDPLTLAAAPIVLLVVALLACLIPARRAMNVDPAVALSHE